MARRRPRCSLGGLSVSLPVLGLLLLACLALTDVSVSPAFCWPPSVLPCLALLVLFLRSTLFLNFLSFCPEGSLLRRVVC